MTSAEVPATPASPAERGALARGWRNFRRWRRGRPFWGGLFTLLAGLEIFGSTQLTTGELQLKVGLEGFQSYVIPAALVLAGLLTWFTPEQRIFYGVLTAFISVYSLIGVNLGGFFIGMLLGILGGSLAASWTPVQLQPQPADEGDEGDETDDDEPSPWDDGQRHGGHRATRMEDLPTLPLTDILPTSTSSPIPQPGPAPSPGDEAAGGDEQPPGGGSLPRRSPRLFAITLVPLALTAAVTALPTSRPALADPCPTPKPGATTASASPTPPTATPSDTPTPRHVRGRRLPQAVTPSGTPTGAPTSASALSATAAPPPPISTQSAAPPPSQKPPAASSCQSATPAPANLRILAAAAGQPPVARQPGRMTGTRVSMTGLTYDGIVDLPTVDGTIRVLQFSMGSSTTNDFELRIPESNGTTTSLKSTELTVTGNVKFYTSRFTGKFRGEVEVTFTPDSPPPPLKSANVFFTDPDIQLVFVTCDTLTAKNLRTVLVRT